MSQPLDDAAAAVRSGELVVYPTETVYGLGADALDEEAVENVFAAKTRDRDDPVSMAVPDVDAAAEYVELTDRERRFMEAFLPGPVTVVVERGPEVPDVLTGGRDRVGVRVPDHDVAQGLLERVAPITATSANMSGRESACTVEELDTEMTFIAKAVLEGGETPGGASTVVDVAADDVIREGEMADAVREWLEGA
jgi:L-threonylcarbamoyladenylate synthase